MRGLCVSSVTGTGLYLIIFSGGSAQHQGCPASFSPVARTFGVNRQQEADPVSGNAVCKEAFVLGRPGNDLLSRVLRHSTIGAEEFNGRVRDGIGFRLLAQITGPAKDNGKGGLGLHPELVTAPRSNSLSLPSRSSRNSGHES
jgi:hypothetical protein